MLSKSKKLLKNDKVRHFNFSANHKAIILCIHTKNFEVCFISDNYEQNLENEIYFTLTFFITFGNNFFYRDDKFSLL